MGDRLFRDDGLPIELGEALGKPGGEGTVYRVVGETTAAKIYSKSMRPEQHDKLRTMVRRAPTTTGGTGGSVPGLGWPRHVLYEDRARRVPVGFVMPCYPGTRELHEIYNPLARMRFAGWITWRDLHLIGASIADIVAAVHVTGHRIGDINQRNVLVSVLERNVAWIDTDSFQIRGEDDSVFPCRVMTPEYMPPELDGKPLDTTPRTPESDAFSLAIVVYQLLTQGSHPFDGVGRGGRALPPREERMRLGISPIGAGRSDIDFPPDTLPFSVLHPGVGALFRRAFGDGARRPAARPTAREWASALRAAAADLVTCRVRASHHHGSLTRACPWCDAHAKTGLDVFPEGSEWQRAIAQHDSPRKAPLATREEWLRKHTLQCVSDRHLARDEERWLLEIAISFDLTKARGKELIDQVVAATSATADLPPGATSSAHVVRATASSAHTLAPTPTPGSVSPQHNPFLAAPRAPSAPSYPQIVPMVSVTSGAVHAFRPPRPYRGIGVVGGALVALVTLGLIARACSSSDPIPPRPLDASPPPPPPPPPPIRRLVVTRADGGLALRRTASTSEPYLTLLPNGTILEPTGRRAQTWIEVRVGGQTGWVSSQYVAPEAPDGRPHSAPLPDPDAGTRSRRLAPTSVKASSFIDANEHHPPEHAFDQNLGTAWNESAPGAGAGEWIEATFDPPRRVARIRMSTGFVKGDLFERNSHLRRVTISINGRALRTLDVGEAQREVTVDRIGEDLVGTLRVTADDVWPGREFDDLCISEIEVLGD